MSTAKRSLSSSPSQSTHSSMDRPTPPPTLVHPAPSPKKPKPTPKSPKSPRTTTAQSNRTIPPSPSTSKPRVSGNGEWTPEKKAILMDEIIAAGYKSVNLEELASRLGLSKRQLVDQLVPNKNNMRAKAVKHVKGE